MNAPIDPRVLPGEDLLRWFRPETRMEEALATALIEARERVDELDQELYDQTDLQAELDQVRGERDEYKAFYEAVEGAFQDSSAGYWPGPARAGEAFIAAVCDQLRKGADHD